MSGFNIANLERRIAALEANRGASLRFGTVTEVDAASNAARVVLSDGGHMVTMPLRVLSRRSTRDQEQCLPDIGDPAAVLFAGQGLEQGVVLGTFHSKALPAPQKIPDIDYHVYEDGTEISYDRTSHTLTVNVMGDIKINATGDISVQCGGTLSLNADLVTMQEGCES